MSTKPLQQRDSLNLHTVHACGSVFDLAGIRTYDNLHVCMCHGGACACMHMSTHLCVLVYMYVCKIYITQHKQADVNMH